jgi:hypothetical protein
MAPITTSADNDIDFRDQDASTKRRCEAGLVAFFVLADCHITIAVKYPGSPVHSWFLEPLGQRVVIGLGLGTATLLLIKSPLGEATNTTGRDSKHVAYTIILCLVLNGGFRFHVVSTPSCGRCLMVVPESYLQAQAQLLQASAQIPLAEAQLAQSQAQADASKANSDYLQRTFKRHSELFYQGRGSHFETGPRHGSVAGRNQRRHVQSEPGSGECCRGKPKGSLALKKELRAPKPKPLWRKLRIRNSNFRTVPSSLLFPGESRKKRFKPGTAFR